MAQGKRNEPTIQPSDTDKAWAAGFFDGEGCVYVRRQVRENYNVVRGWKPSPYALASASQVDPRPLQFLQQRWGGSLRSLKRRRHPNERDAWEWNCSARQAYQFFHDVMPWLLCKRAQAVNALRLEPLRKAQGSGQALTDEEVAVHLEIVAEARRLNQERPTWHELPAVF
jgi:hypothetical protein